MPQVCPDKFWIFFSQNATSKIRVKFDSQSWVRTNIRYANSNQSSQLVSLKDYLPSAFVNCSLDNTENLKARRAGKAVKKKGGEKKEKYKGLI